MIDFVAVVGRVAVVDPVAVEGGVSVGVVAVAVEGDVNVGVVAGALVGGVYFGVFVAVVGDVGIVVATNGCAVVVDAATVRDVNAVVAAATVGCAVVVSAAAVGSVIVVGGAAAAYNRAVVGDGLPFVAATDGGAGAGVGVAAAVRGVVPVQSFLQKHFKSN